ncbi:MAG: surface carbohydrate biosynthesis protein [Desulfobacteraceae bacterium]|nr:surface carbohydrate biosynthesis protein [Desulfobacteraceae bacterium]
MKYSLIIPVENQVREFDPKLLLACIAARRGFSAMIGSRWEIDNRIASLPRSIYLSKSMTARGGKMLRIMHKIGHEIVAWDEEALVHLPPETFFSRRISPIGIKHVSHLFAWGQDNADLWRQYPSLSPETPIHITGNPRGDMLRPEMRDFYAKEIKELRKAYGDFILINTNVNHVNAFYPHQNLFLPVKRPGEEPRFGKAARGMSREFAEGLRRHKQAVFNDFKELIPSLSKAFPDRTLVVRPHPTENHDVYSKIAASCERVRVTNEGNVVPWLLAARVLVHNGCTTGVEAYAMGVPAISYRKSVNEYYDNGFYRLPNLLSYQCFNFEELCITLEKILAGELGAADGDERQSNIDRYLAAQEGSLACERIVEVLEKMTQGRSELPKPDLLDRLEGWSVANGRRLVKGLLSYFPNTHNRPEFQRHRFPGISLDALNEKIERIQQILREDNRFKVEQLSDVLFRISA